jgi:Tfp pilus assembly protein PilF
MPDRTYMVVDPRRDHSFRIPRPDLSVRLGVPNACNDCHTNQTPAWAAEAIDDWYGERTRDTHYGEILAAGRRADPGAGALLARLASDITEPPIVRATALDLLLDYGTEGRGAFIVGLRDPDPLVRTTAVAGLERLDIQERAPLIEPALLDPVRAVRLEAARVLTPVTGSSPGGVPTALAAALAEYERVQLSLADTPNAHLNLGVIHASAGDRLRAAEDYRTALARDPAFTPASLNLATLLNELGRNPEAAEVLSNAIAEDPPFAEAGELYYSLGLVQGEMNALPAAVQSLERAVRLLPARPRIRYNYALALQRLGRRPEAEVELLESYRTGPDDAAVVQALAIFYTQDRDWDAAVQWAERLVAMLPGDPRARQFLDGVIESRGR